MSLAMTDTGTLPLPRDPSSPERARNEVAAMCRDLHPDVTTVAQLLVSELVTNALRHGRGRIEMQLEREPGRLYVSVEDDSDGHPAVRTSALDDEGGRGLLIVETLATSWGVRRSGRGGKAVWFTLRLVG